MLADLAPSGFVGLCWYDGGARSFYANYPLNKIEDLKGKKYRVMPNATAREDGRGHGRISAFRWPPGQVFSAIQTGVIDGAENNAPSLISFNHYQVAKYYMLDEHLRLPEVLFMSKIVWDKLGKDQQAAIRKAAGRDRRFPAQEVGCLRDRGPRQDQGRKARSSSPVKDQTPFKNAVKQLLAEESPKFAETIKAIDAAPAEEIRIPFRTEAGPHRGSRLRSCHSSSVRRRRSRARKERRRANGFFLTIDKVIEGFCHHPAGRHDRDRLHGGHHPQGLRLHVRLVRGDHPPLPDLVHLHGHRDRLPRAAPPRHGSLREAAPEGALRISTASSIWSPFSSASTSSSTAGTSP